MKSAATPRGDNVALNRFMAQLKRQQRERTRPKGYADRLLAFAEKVQQQFEARQRRET
jgi:hypothetical protein